MACNLLREELKRKSWRQTILNLKTLPHSYKTKNKKLKMKEIRVKRLNTMGNFLLNLDNYKTNYSLQRGILKLKSLLF